MSEEWYKFTSKRYKDTYQYFHGTLGEAIDLAEIREKRNSSTWKDGCHVAYISNDAVEKDRPGLLGHQDTWKIRDRIQREKKDVSSVSA